LIQNKNIIHYLILSITAAIILIILAFLGGNNVSYINEYDRFFIGGLYIIICIFGFTFAIFPGWIRRITIIRNTNVNLKIFSKKRKGHHPDCKRFKNHIITSRNRTLCAGCFGLAIGSIISIILIIFYIILINKLSFVIFNYLFFLGLFIICIVYIEIIFPKRIAVVHTLLNIFFVISFFFITISIFEITRNIFSGVIAIILSFLWFDTRIYLSNYQHFLICKNCNEDCGIIDDF
jgi:hypothetical protein